MLMRESFQAIWMTKSLPVVSVAYTVSEYLQWYTMLHWRVRRELSPVAYKAQDLGFTFVLIQLFFIHPVISMYTESRYITAKTFILPFAPLLSFPTYPILAERHQS